MSVIDLSLDEARALSQCLLSNVPTTGSQALLRRIDDLIEEMTLDLEHAQGPLAERVRDVVLRRAGSLINGRREQDYGTAKESFGRLAELWTVVLGTPITPVQVTQALMMLKVSRMIQTPDHADSYVDLVGYAALAAELAGAEVADGS